MALIHALMRYKSEGKMRSFDMHGDKKATVALPSGKSLTLYMSDEYIIGGSEIAEAAENPKAQYLIYNSWDKVTQSAYSEARRIGIEIHNFGAFGFHLDELNGRP
ncbi:hypothetical protein [Candidatus Nitrotoga sp. AM1P]|uniref:hypothetical protein n=1 Tax=Candidatus Nitrotoga sp. AM1P TaxID=2559597 RepID=UPI0010B78F67|nr:hypothetical protein [Candidatus Nitrotoga sp. AM1P]BBJ22641.1 hypothetical protein W01_05680 [Candidatus Nitrotoga sp. AM1P]